MTAASEIRPDQEEDWQVTTRLRLALKKVLELPAEEGAVRRLAFGGL